MYHVKYVIVEMQKINQKTKIMNDDNTIKRNSIIFEIGDYPLRFHCRVMFFIQIEF